jgi:hypothetical protein
VVDSEQSITRLPRLEPLVGRWRIEAPSFALPPALREAARMTVEWILDGAFLVLRTSIPVPAAPQSRSVIGPSPTDGYTAHDFDSRGTARTCAMTFDGREWSMARHAPDFSALPFHQRWLATVPSHAIHGRWDTSSDGHTRELDFVPSYHRVR